MKRWFFVLGILALFAMNSCTQEKTAAEIIVGRCREYDYEGYYDYPKQKVWEFRKDGTMSCVLDRYQDFTFYGTRVFKGTYTVEGPKVFIKCVEDEGAIEMSFQGRVVYIDDFGMDLSMDDGLYEHYHYFYRTDEAASENAHLTFNLSDSFGDGWNGAYLEVGINDYSVINMTVEDGYASSYSNSLFKGDEIWLTWHRGGDDQECSFEILNNDNGTVVFQNTGGFPETVRLRID